MFTLNELQSIDRSCFQVIDQGTSTITLRSKDTGHRWHIVRYEDNYNPRFMIFHQHREDEDYHLHSREKRFDTVLKNIRAHDHYVLTGKWG